MYSEKFSFEPPNRTYNNRIPPKYPTPTNIDSSYGSKQPKPKLYYFPNQGPTMNHNHNHHNKQRFPSNHVDPEDEISHPKRSSIWRINFIIVFAPLLLWGFPIHLLFQRRRIYSLGEWLKWLCPCTSPCFSLITIATSVISIFLNILLIYLVGRFLYVLLFTAVVSQEVIDYAGDIVRMLPVVIPLDLLWLRGYKLANFLATFDRVVLNWRPVDGEKADFRQIGSGRLKFLAMYGMITLAHCIHYVAEYYQGDRGQGRQTPLTNSTVVNQVYQIALVDSIAVLNTLAMPVYVCFCWAIKYELAMTKEYIESLIGAGVVPNYAHFNEFKKISKKITEDVLMVNATFSLLLSVVLGLLGFMVYDEGYNLVMTIFKEVIAVVQDKTRVGFDPPAVRLLVADCVIIGVYGALLFLTYWQAVKTNDDIRALHVWLNDFVTEPDSRLNLDLHDTYKLLKWYIHSRLEQEVPALLSIMAIGLIPSMGRRLVRYRVLH